MKTSKYLILLLLLFSFLKADINSEYTFGITVHKFEKNYRNKVKRITIKILENMSKTLEKKINIVFIEDEDTLLKDFKRFEKLNTMIIYSDFYLKNKDEIKKISKNPFLFNNSSEKTKYYLIANKKSNIKSIKDLKDKSFITLSIDDNYANWLDTLVRKELDVSYKKIIKDESIVDKNEKLILNVYFNKVDFTAVSKVVYDDMLLLNPSIEKNLVILEESKPIFFFGLGVFHKNTPKELTDAFQKTVDSGEFNKEFGDIYKMLNLYGVQKTSFEDLKPLDDFYSEYLELKSKSR